MQLRAGIVYAVLFMVVAAGAYAVIATAESPQVTIDEADADHQLEQGNEITVEDRTYNVSEVDGAAGTGTLEHINDSVPTDVAWSGASAANGDAWDDGDTVQFEEEGTEYSVYIYAPPEGGDGEDGNESDSNGEDGNESDEEAQPETFLLIEAVESEDGEGYTFLERPDGVYVIVEEDGQEVVRHVTEVDDIDTREYAVGDEVTFYNSDLEEQVDGEVTSLATDEVTVEYTGEEVTEVSLAHNEEVMIEQTPYGVHFPSEDVVYLTEDVESFQAQHQAVDDHNERIHGFWWAIGLSVIAIVLLAGLAFMPLRG
ncbi:hypothetical protein [Natronosalvus halobius]|uniref:hypothetical protein n=1 Tax=Natronosalvus halobius TaxID=2953746 RepID=UPI00209E83FA|nr:hypothetical protein [Natronosalvus halobius]USZ70926.1 hypothetical protein NGM15_12575 [Natronosalvus halobius]